MNPPPSEIVPTAARPNKQAGSAWLNFALPFLQGATLLSLPAGAIGIHTAAGLLMLSGCAVHLYMHRRWIKSVFLHPPVNLAPSLRLRRRLFVWTCFSGLLCGLSGLAVLPMAFCGTPVHILSGLAFLGLSNYHLVLHRNWFATRLERIFTGAR